MLKKNLAEVASLLLATLIQNINLCESSWHRAETFVYQAWRIFDRLSDLSTFSPAMSKPWLTELQIVSLS